MRRDPRKYLFDIRRAADLVAEFTAGKQLADYLREPMLRAAVEREFGIIGEAMTQLARLDGEIAARISHHRRAISFRNALIHGYDEIDDEVVWDTVTVDLPTRRTDREPANTVTLCSALSAH